MPTLDRDGVAIHYEVAGDGPALLLTHGYSATGQMWAGQIATLAPYFKVITWDMRGHGQRLSRRPGRLFRSSHGGRHGRPPGRRGR